MQNKLRAIATGAALAFTLSLLAGSALAQSADDAEPGKPLSLLQLLIPHKPEAKTAAKPAEKSRVARAARTKATEPEAAETKTAERHWHHHRAHFAARHREAAPTAGPEAVAAAPEAPTTASEVATAAPEVATAAPAVTPSPDSPLAFTSPATTDGTDLLAATPAATATPQVSELVVDGRTVQIASPDQINAIDLAANDQPATNPTATAPSATAENADAAPAQVESVAADTLPPTDQANSDHVVAFARQADSPTSHPSWLAGLLATLGGALAAGSVAWFLIGCAPQRTYG